MDHTTDINMQMFARNAGTTISFAPGSFVFKEGDTGNCVYIVQSGVVEIVAGDKVADVCGPNDAMGFMTVIDGGLHTASARVREAAEISIVDDRKFRFMIDEVPNFALYIMKAMAHRIRGMREAM
jgi:CRP/FNR family transcriptional regulator, cyclic AMP receptor protein